MKRGISTAVLSVILAEENMKESQAVPNFYFNQ
jgi:hypothetical protein